MADGLRRRKKLSRDQNFDVNYVTGSTTENLDFDTVVQALKMVRTGEDLERLRAMG